MPQPLLPPTFLTSDYVLQDTYLQNHINNKHGGSPAIKPLNTFSIPLPQRQPTSIQAATSMICKMEGELLVIRTIG